MRMSHLFSQTLREAPSEAEATSHQLLMRAGFIRPLAAGVFSYLPLAKRSLTKIENIMRQEIEAIGGQEITMPVVHPADLWRQTGRWQKIGPELGRFQDRNGRDMVLAMTHEEVVASLARGEIRSHRQLPALIYHIQTKWRDDPRPRSGLIRVREFTMLDSYSLDADWESLEKQYQSHYQAYLKIFQRCALPVVVVRSDTGIMGGDVAHEFMYLVPIGEDTLLFCDACGYAANRQIARFSKPQPEKEEQLPVDKVPTPHTSTIQALAELLQVPESRTAKAVFMIATIGEGDDTREQFIFAVVRGDMEVNETKLANALGARDLRPATEEEIKATGAVPGYASPIGLKDVLVIVDDLIPVSPNLVAGANEDGFHVRNTNYGRDYSAQMIADIVAAGEGDACPNCGAPMRTARGVEVGNIFKLGTHFTDALGASFTDENGQSRSIIMGSYGIGVGRLLACIAEQHHDEQGLLWPISVAPYPVHLVLLGSKTGEPERLAEHLYDELLKAGIEALFDDRVESPGVKFNDADLIGLPLRLTVAERALKNGGVEFKRRSSPDRRIVPLPDVLNEVKSELAALQAEVDQFRVQSNG